MPIGGEFERELPAREATGGDVLESWRRRLPGDTTLVSTGRAAVRRIVSAIRGADPKLRTFLLPSYLCDSLVVAFERAGLETQFYPVRADLGVEHEALLGQVESGTAGGVLFINYFGFPVPAADRALFVELKKRLWVVEDCAPGGLVETRGAKIGSTGHFAFTSVRKYTPLPEGGIVWNRSGIEMAAKAPVAMPAWVRQRLLGKALRAEFLRSDAETPARKHLEAAFLALFAASERSLDETGGEDAPSHAAFQFHDVDIDAALARRRDNYQQLAQLFAAEPVPRVRPMLERAAEDASPSLFPVLCEDAATREKLRSALYKDAIFCPVHWPTPRALPKSLRPAADAVADRMLGLPVDQRYGRREMSQVHEATLRAASSR